MKWESMLSIGRNGESMKNRICLAVVKLFLSFGRNVARWMFMPSVTCPRMDQSSEVVQRMKGLGMFVRCICFKNIGNKYGKRRNISPRNKKWHLERYEVVVSGTDSRYLYVVWKNAFFLARLLIPNNI